MATGIKGTSSMKLHHLDVSQKSAWHMAHRIRQSFEEKQDLFTGPVEADESYFGGKQSNRHRDERRYDGPGRSGKRVVTGVKDRATNRIGDYIEWCRGAGAPPIRPWRTDPTSPFATSAPQRTPRLPTRRPARTS